VRARIKRFGLLRRGTDDPAGLEVETAEQSIPPLASAAVPTAPPAPLRWHRRRITFLRTTLAPTDLDETRLTGTRVLDTIVQKVLTFGGDIDEIGPSEIGAVFGLEPIEDGPRRAAHVATAVQRAGERGYPEEGGPFGVKSAIHVGEVLVAFLSGGSEIEANTRRESWGAADRILEQAETGTIVVTAAAVPFLERRFLIGQMRDSVDGYELCGRERRGLAPEGQMADFVGLTLYWRSRRWTGGRDLRARIRADLESNTAAVHVLSVVDAIKVEEAEDEGSTFFLELDTGETVAIGGQFLDRFVTRGFPWRQFEIREGARSGLFLGLEGRGERIVPSLVKRPLSMATVRELGISPVRWKILPVAFEDLRRVA
jgi:hypothetical protein